MPRPFTGLRQLKGPDNIQDPIIRAGACLYHDHSSDTKDAQTWRHSDTYSCVECVEEMKQGKISLDAVSYTHLTLPTIA